MSLGQRLHTVLRHHFNDSDIYSAADAFKDEAPTFFMGYKIKYIFL